MKKITHQTVIFGSICMLFLFIGCGQEVNPLAESEQSSMADKMPDSPGSTSGTTVEPAEYTLEAGVIDDNAELEAVDQYQGTLSFDISMANPADLSSTVSVFTPYEAPSTDPSAINLPYQVYQQTPRNLIYNGSTQLAFAVDGVSYSRNITGFEANLMDWFQEMQANAYQGPEQLPDMNSMNSTSNEMTVNSKDVNLKTMSDQEIKKWLQSKGYKVQKLGNRQFKLIRRLGGKKGRPEMAIYSIFDAETAEMTSLGVGKNGNRLSKILVKRNHKQMKEKIIRLSNSLFGKKAKKLFLKVTANNSNKNF